MSEQPQQVEPEVPATDAPAPTPVADEVLLAAVDLARRALLEVTRPETVGSVVGHVVEDEHVLTMLFAADLSGYPGWHWSVTIARVADAEPTVLETELMPGDTALLAPEWVPWSERLADYRTAQEAAAAAAAETAGGATGDLGELADEFDEDELEDEDEVDEADLDDEAELDAAFGHDSGDDVFDGIDIDSLDDSADEDSGDDDSDDEDSDGDDSDDSGDDDDPAQSADSRS